MKRSISRKQDTPEYESEEEGTPATLPLPPRLPEPVALVTSNSLDQEPAVRPSSTTSVTIPHPSSTTTQSTRGRSYTDRSLTASHSIANNVDSCARCVELGFTCRPTEGQACGICRDAKKRCSNANGKRGRSASRPLAKTVENLDVPSFHPAKSLDAEEPPAKRARRRSWSRPPSSSRSKKVPAVTSTSRIQPMSATLIGQRVLYISQFIF